MAEADFIPKSNESQGAPIDGRLNELQSRLWTMHNTLAFMTAALPEDKIGELPVHCTLCDLQDHVFALASDLSIVTSDIRREQFKHAASRYAASR